MLRGVGVLDLTRLLPGGYCSQRLLQLGADVLKIEPPGGDPLRHLPGGAAYFETLHQGKRLLTLDLKTASGRERLEQEVAAADVLVEGFRPGVMERNAIGYAALSGINPRLVYCAITGYGSTGPLARRAGHDLNYLARSGALSLMPAAAGVPMIPGLQLADLAGGLDAAFLIAAALFERERTNKGRRVEVSMTDVIRGWTSLPRAASAAGITPMQLTGEMPCYHVYPVRDGLLTVAALEPPFWQEFCHVIGRNDLVSRQFDASVVGEVAEILAKATQGEWVSRFGDRDVCVEPVNELDEVDG